MQALTLNLIPSIMKKLRFSNIPVAVGIIFIITITVIRLNSQVGDLSSV